MNMKTRASDLCKVSVVALALVVTTLVLAQPQQDDEIKLIAKVKADGILFGFAQACNLSKEEVNSLFNLKLVATRELVQSKVPHYTFEHFKADFSSGIEVAQSFVARTDPKSDAYKKNCQDIHQKVNSLLAEK